MRSRSLVHLAALGLATLVVVGLLTGMSVSRSNATSAHLEDVHDQTLTALESLMDVESFQAQIGVRYIGLLAQTAAVDATALSSTLDQANQSALASTDAWREFTRASLDLPGEQDIRLQFEETLAAGTAAGTDLAAVVFGPLVAGDVSAAALEVRLDGIRSMEASTRSLLTMLDELIDLYQAQLDASITGEAATTAGTAKDIGTIAAAATLLLVVVWSMAMRSQAHRGRDLAAARRQGEIEAGRNELEARLQRGLTMATDEAECFNIVGVALRELSLDQTEVLVADSSRAHFHQVVSTTADASLGCGVTTPTQCPAARTGQTQTFVSNQTMDTCPFLRDHPTGACSAVCAPINIAGKAIGVMSATGPLGEVVDPNVVATMELVARKTGERIGAVRMFSKSEIQARTDSLTGLLNRRSVESEASRVLEQGGRYAVAFGDLDHFKRLNDVYGHETGDRALRLFSRVLRDSVRPQDTPARYGGEEFVIILPGCSADDAVQVVERVRERLAEALEGGTTPPFTVSFGVASDDSGIPFADLVGIADAALLTAKAEGRNCTVVGGASTPNPPTPLVDVSSVA
jgi:diguanylate cyclase (GGDEF)-like protein